MKNPIEVEVMTIARIVVLLLRVQLPATTRFLLDVPQTPLFGVNASNRLEKTETIEHTRVLQTKPLKIKIEHTRVL